ncbi:MAG: hypothetical protein RLZZ95_111, partial [Pseudomonadota bacterium]
MATGGRLNPSANTQTPQAEADGRCASSPLYGVSDIDWSAPWLADWRAVGEPMAQRIVSGQPQPEVL